MFYIWISLSLIWTGKHLIHHYPDIKLYFKIPRLHTLYWNGCFPGGDPPNNILKQVHIYFLQRSTSGNDIPLHVYRITIYSQIDECPACGHCSFENETNTYVILCAWEFYTWRLHIWQLSRSRTRFDNWLNISFFLQIRPWHLIVWITLHIAFSNITQTYQSQGAQLFSLRWCDQKCWMGTHFTRWRGKMRKLVSLSQILKTELIKSPIPYKLECSYYQQVRKIPSLLLYED